MESVGGGDESNRIGALPPDIISQYSGLEVLKRMMNGGLPLPAMSEIIPFRLTEVGSGRAVFESTPDGCGSPKGGRFITIRRAESHRLILQLL